MIPENESAGSYDTKPADTNNATKSMPRALHRGITNPHSTSLLAPVNSICLGGFHLLEDLAVRGMQPARRLIWLGLGVAPAKRNAITIAPEHLPSEAECKAVAGLDVIVLYPGYLIGYGILRRLCGALYAARPRRLQVIDLDYQRVAYLKLGGRRCRF